MKDALERAHRVAGTVVTTGGYTVWRVGSGQREQAERWQAGQSLKLRSRDGAAMLRLVGELQQRGLAVSQLGWQLSDEAERAARERALAQALKSLRGRADDAAGLLGLQFDAFREVRLDSPRPVLLPRAVAVQAAVPTQPVAESSDVTVSATAEADVVLKPR